VGQRDRPSTCIARGNTRALAVIVTFLAIDAALGAYLATKPDAPGVVVYPGFSGRVPHVRHGPWFARYVYVNLVLGGFAVVGTAIGLSGVPWRPDLGLGSAHRLPYQKSDRPNIRP
jgi:hypothetical protein